MSDHDHTDGDTARWRCNHMTNPNRYADQWVLESDEYHGIAIIELPWLSKWHKDRHPEWETEWNDERARCQAAADLIQSAPFMLEALQRAKDGDTSLIDEAIQRATGQLDWLGGPMDETNAQCRITPASTETANTTGD